MNLLCDETVAATGSDASASDRSGAVPLGKYADFAPGFVKKDIFLPAPSQVRGWYLRSVGRSILKSSGIKKRLRWCGSRISHLAQGVGVYSRPDRSIGRLSGVCVCGQSLCCPVCAPRIAAFRAHEVEELFQRISSAGYEARLVTYTLPHSKDDELGKLLDMVGRAWRRLGKGGRSDKLREGAIGNVTAAEINWGMANGWHPHKHQLRIDEKGAFCEYRHKAAWLAALESIGRRTEGAEERAFDVGAVGNEAGARYVSKLSISVDAQARASGVGLELAGGANKGRNLIALLADAAAGDLQARQVWLAGVREIVDRKVTSLRWSRGLRAKFGLSVEKTDEEVAEEEKTPDDEFLGQLNPLQWRIVVEHRAELALCVAANRGAEAVNSMLQGLGAGALNENIDVDSTECSGASRMDYLQLSKSFTRDHQTIAEIQREFEAPSPLTRKQLEGMKG